MSHAIPIIQLVREPIPKNAGIMIKAGKWQQSHNRNHAIKTYTVDSHSLPASWDHLDTNGLGLCNHALAQALQAQSRQSCLGLLDAGDLVDVLEGDFADNFMAGVHGAADAVLAGLDIGSVQQKPCSGRRAEVKGEGAIRTDGDTRGNGNAGVDVSSTGIELLDTIELATSEIPVRRRYPLQY